MRLFCTGLLIVFLFSGLGAQFSPGELSKYHAHLEGNKHCLECHEQNKKQISDGCIECHSPLKERITAGRGYHKDKGEACEDCHSDHNGRNFELVYWPKDISQFDHGATGYPLMGKHSALNCSQCHKRDFIHGESIITWAAENRQFPVLDRTFLGLKQNCLGCHQDVHQGEVSSDCVSCHNTSDWKLVISVFDHNRARFHLEGTHLKVDCEKCHRIQTNRVPMVWQLTGIAFDRCGRCHEDFHRGSYGASCETCHQITNWKTDLKPFDHSVTKYPLIDKHIGIACLKCHKSDLAGGLPKYDTCLRCHQDEHYGQFDGRADGGDCAACHTIKGFKPTTFTAAQHQLSRFILEGAHLAVPCIFCHKDYQPLRGVSTTQFTWKQNRCENCHVDNHRNQFQLNFQNRCDFCHNSLSFTELNFDHQQTTFPLDGKHIGVACGKCHEQEADSDGIFIRYSPLAHNCSDCHTLTDQIR
ncbi:MAG: cytochrome c3 family protein [Fidelibacterota bacterium]